MKARAVLVLAATILLATLLPGVAAISLAQTNKAPYWPQLHGPNRDNRSSDKGLLKQWPAEGPKLVWKSSLEGNGYSGVSIADGRIFTAADVGRRQKVIALDMDGQPLWSTPNGESWNGPYPGSRTTPTYYEGILYHLGPTGSLAAYEADSGKQVWAVDLKDEFGARYGIWALAENVVVDGDLVFCVPGGSKALVAALDRHTGKTVWTNTAMDETAAYCSPTLITWGGKRQLITLTQKSVVGIDISNGEMLWSHPHVTRHDQNITTPVFHQGHVFTASGHSGGGRLVRLSEDSRSATEVWHNRTYDNCHGGVIRLDDRLYFSGCRAGGKAFFCVDFLTGEPHFADSSVTKLSLTWADGLFYGLTADGRMMLIEPGSDGINVVSQFDVPKENKEQYFAHPVVCGGLLYIRHGSQLYAYDVRAE